MDAVDQARAVEGGRRMTNEEALNDMLRKTFPRTIFIRGINERNKTKSIVFSDEWLKMPYEAESEDEE